MRFVGLCVFLLALLAGSVSAQTTTPDPQQTTQQPPASGVLQPNSTSPLQGATPATPTTPTAPPLQTPVTPGTAQVAPPPLGRVFASETGIIFNAIKPDKVMDFETVIAKLRAALANSKDPVRQQQGWGWKIYKAVEPGPNNTVLYIFIMDPAVKGADYGIAKILAEAYPDQITDLYRMYTGAFSTAGQAIVNLEPVTDKPATPGAAPAGTTAPTSTSPGTTTAPPPATAPPTTAAPPIATPPSN